MVVMQIWTHFGGSISKFGVKYLRFMSFCIKVYWGIVGFANLSKSCEKRWRGIRWKRPRNEWARIYNVAAELSFNQNMNLLQSSVGKSGLVLIIVSSIEANGVSGICRTIICTSLICLDRCGSNVEFEKRMILAVRIECGLMNKPWYLR